MEENNTLNNTLNNLDEDLYNTMLIKENISVPPEKFNNKIDIFLQESLNNKIEGKCISEGFVKNNSVEILKKSIGTLRGSRFNGDINYQLLFNALICNPKIGSIIKCDVKLVNNKLGILGNNGPLNIIIGRQFHTKPELLDDINIGDIIDIKIIDTKFSLNDKEIKIIGKLKNDIDNISKKDIMIDDLNQIDNEDIDDLNDNSFKGDIDNLELESLDGINDDSDIDDLDDIDESDDEIVADEEDIVIEDVENIDDEEDVENDDENDDDENDDENDDEEDDDDLDDEDV